jgi:RHS repeat-associated protein
VEVGGAQPGLGYTGEWWDESLEMVYLRARWYQPQVGRFARRDPVQLEANSYLYASGDPINRIDPQGLLSNSTIVASLGMDSFEEVLAFFEHYQDWALLKLLQEAEVGDTVYSGLFSKTRYRGSLECTENGTVHMADPPDPSMSLRETVCSLNAHGDLSPLSIGTGYDNIWNANWYYLNHNRSLPAYTNKTSSGFLPDYALLNIGDDLVSPFIAGGFSPGVGANFVATVDRYGHAYIGLAGEVGWGIPAIPSVHVGIGWIKQRPFTGDSWIPEKSDLRDFIAGFGGGATIVMGLGGSAAYNYDDSFPEFIATEVLIGTPTYSWSFVGGMLQMPFGNIDQLAWDWIDTYPIRHGYGRQDINMVDDGPVDCDC